MKKTPQTDRPELLDISTVPYTALQAPTLTGTAADISGDPKVKFEAALIEAYEQALQEGLTPETAISVVLAWVADETARLACN
jgi:hypothetical protein